MQTSEDGGRLEIRIIYGHGEDREVARCGRVKPGAICDRVQAAMPRVELQ
jgi:hypothetical protein